MSARRAPRGRAPPTLPSARAPPSAPPPLPAPCRCLILLLGQRLDGLEKGWDALSRMWESRSQALTQCLGFQEFQKDAKQAEAILSNQVGRGTGSWGHLSRQENL